MRALAEYLYRAERHGDLRLLLIGGRSLEAHGIVRATKDIDFLIAVSDIQAMSQHLTKIGYTKAAETSIFSRWTHASVSEEDIDVMYVNDTTFTNLFSDSVPFQIGSATLHVPTVPRLIALKLHAIKNNPERTLKDTSDIQNLLQHHSTALSLEGLRTLCEKYGPPGIFAQLSPNHLT
jgi:predicted nucleotidyltransferase